MLATWVWGMKEGRSQGREEGIIQGIGQTVDTLHQMGYIQLDDNEDEHEIDLGDDVKVTLTKEDEDENW